jgi:acyl transferase domain-containing protein/NAD(P)-dependent dehydrogenase (short-subunit alcohol dehydrogenase family)
MSRDIAIIGMACRFPDAGDVLDFWANVAAGRTSFREIPADRWDHRPFRSESPREPDKTPVARGAFLDDVRRFPALHHGIAPRRVEMMDPQHRLVLEAVRVALQDAGLENADFDRSRVGTFLGLSTSEYRNIITARTRAMEMASGAFGAAPSDAAAARALAEAVQNVSPITAFSMPGTLHNMAAANVAHAWQLRGPAFTVDAACSSSLVAVHGAMTYLRSGLCDLAIAGGVYVNLGPENLVAFSRIGAISRSGRCRPFDAEADGFLQGEGVGVVVLKRMDDALRDGDRIHAVIRGAGINNDGLSDGPMAPSLEGQLEVIRLAYDDAGLDPSTVEYVECHGTATPVGDPIEVGALLQLFSGAGAERVWLSSVKANIGHTMSAAGVAGLIKAVLVLENGVIPPQPSFDRPHPALRIEGTPLRIAREPAAWVPSRGRRRAAVSSFGFGGTNCHLLLEEAPARSQVTGEDRAELVVLSAPTRELLASHAQRVAGALERSGATLADVAHTLTGSRDLEEVRLAIVARSATELTTELRKAAVRLAQAGDLPAQLGPNVFTTPGARGAAEALRVAFLFPGQGAQRVGLLRGFCERFPAFRGRLEELADAVRDLFDRPLLWYLYPERAGRPFDPARAEAELTETEVCQPVMAALGIALADFLGHLGIRPFAVTGHSLGELAAAAAGGLLRGEDALRFVAERGHVMAAATPGDPGAMAAAMADRALVEERIAGIQGVWVANLNHPRQTVLSGSTAGVEAAVARLRGAGIESVRLKVSHAFHSPLMQGAIASLTELASRLDVRPPLCPVVSAVTAAPYEAQSARELFVRHATAPVDFVGALRRCADLGADFFLQVGAGTTLTGFAAATLGKEGQRGIRSLASVEDDGETELWRTLGHLAVLGQPIAFRLLFEGQGRAVVTLPATPLVSEPYWVVREKASPIDVPLSEGGKATAGAAASDDLVALFREQTALLRTHAEILARQNAVLSGQSGLPQAEPAPPARLPASEAAGPPEAPPAVEPPADRAPPQESVHDRVFELVAKVSAFPPGSLELSQSLVLDLGFDSIMLVDLATGLGAAFPDQGGVPQSLFHQKTTIGDVIRYLEREGATRASVPPAPARTTPEVLHLTRYRPVTAERARSALPGEPFRPRGTTLVTADPGGIAAALAERLRGEGLSVALAQIDSPEGVDATFADLVREGTPPSAVIHLGGLAALRPLDDALADGRWPDPVPVAQRLAAALHRATEGAPDAFVAVTGLGGSFGFTTPDEAVWQAALAGFAKALAREWTDALVRIIDVDPAQDGRALAGEIVGELASAERDLEVGLLSGGRRIGVHLEPAPAGPGALPLDERSVVLVTGGGRGLGAKAAIDLARRTRCRLILAGTARLEHAPQARATLEAVCAAGSQARYVQWDVRGPAPSALHEARAALGPVTAVIHAAGVLRDRRVEGKAPDDLRHVLDVKVGGLLQALRATAGDPVRLLVVFSSWSGRFGNAGQTDYAAASELVNRLTTALAARPGLRAVAVAWPPWEDSEMARSIPEAVRVAMRREGVVFLSDEMGLGALAEEIAAADRGEVLWGGDLPAEVRRVRGAVRLSIDSHPFLDHHRLKEKPLLPLASALDTIAFAARETARGDGPLVVSNLRLYSGVEVERPRLLAVEAHQRSWGGRAFAQMTVELRHADLDGSGRTLAYRAEAAIGREALGAAEADPPAPTGGARPGADLPLSVEAFYRDHTFHGPLLRAIDRVEEVGPDHVVGWVRPSRPAEWIPGSARERWEVDPRVVDGSFQLVAYWLRVTRERAAFPLGFRRYVQHAPFGEGPVKCTVVCTSFAEAEIEGSIRYEDGEGRLLATMAGARAQLLDAPPGEKPLEVDEAHWRSA